MADDTTIAADDPYLTAGELALGVLEGAELAAARRMLLADRGFAEAVEWWELRLAAMAEAAGEYTPSAHVWKGIETRIDALSSDTTEVRIEERRRGPAPWSIATALAGIGAAAAALALFLSTPSSVETAPPEIAAVPGDQFVAQLQDEEAGRRLASRIDPDNRRLALTIAGLEVEAGKTPELWVIPEGGAPISLGAIPQGGSFARDLSEEETGLLVAGATLAVTFEENTGVPHDTPTMPIILAGALDKV